MKIESWELISIILIFPGIFALTLVIEGIAKIRDSNWMGVVSLCAGVILLVVLVAIYMIFPKIKL